MICEEEYVYEEVDVTDVKDTGGSRLVGARAESHSNVPFIVAINQYKYELKKLKNQTFL